MSDRITKKVPLLNESFAEIYFDKTSKLIVAKWTGLLELHQVRKGCACMTKFIKANKVAWHLSDHRQLKVLSRDVQDYLTNAWFPEVEAVGLTKISVLVSEDVFAAATVSKVNHDGSVGNLQIRMFNSEFECKKWFLS